ncbi:hypothetical protein C8T65DRAFT_649230 [Cerioporus squamosus]|nr:hypothetical protein C8T65DRAFT_649230 [Cerioporus squamosus]
MTSISIDSEAEIRLPGGRLPKPIPKIVSPFKRWIPEYHLGRAQGYHEQAKTDVKLIGKEYQQWARKKEFSDLVNVNAHLGQELQEMYDQPKWTLPATRAVKHRARDHQVSAKRSSQRADQESLYSLVPEPPQLAPEQEIPTDDMSIAGSEVDELPGEAIESKVQNSAPPLIPDDHSLLLMSETLSELYMDADSGMSETVSEWYTATDLGMST